MCFVVLRVLYVLSTFLAYRFVFFKETSSFAGAGLLSRRECVLVGSLSTGWDGWLPADELEITKD